MGQTAFSPRLSRIGRNQDVIVAVVIIGILLIMLVKMPPWALDLLLTVNISVAVLMILVTMYVQNPLQFSVFPSMLLVTTLSCWLSWLRCRTRNARGGSAAV